MAPDSHSATSSPWSIPAPGHFSMSIGWVGPSVPTSSTSSPAPGALNSSFAPSCSIRARTAASSGA
jgi:hypothetical protein